ncbi:MAG: DUF1080 domain-containing protein [Bryobacterales bacterium]|nr:DUF1080 domain-containing protein [Bryobacterales bacterium]MDE0261404.1 DUF1080 domain-containing protein [Bryobacterales bacterium]MDE0622324.1 DUF1080 domain-containing protein [Bryobacterales bacterium]
MKLTKFALAAVLGTSLCYPASAADWITLFDGETLNGWSQRNGYATYRVEDGTILGRTSPGSPNSFLCTTTNFGDFELEFEVKVDDGLNSGVMIRSAQKPESTGSGRNERAGRVYGPQVEIESSGPDGAESGYVYGEATGRGWLTPEDKLIPHKAMRDGEWNSYRIVANGVRIQTWINGKAIEDISDEEIFKTHPGGFIGLQVHGIRQGTGPYEVAWRNIRVKPLN